MINENIKLINNLPCNIDEMIVDGETVKPSTEYTSKTKGEHVIYILLEDSNILSLYNMFEYIINLVSISFTSKFNSQNVQNIEGMFNDCTSLISVDFSFFNSSNVSNMKMLFYNCYLLQSINFSNFNTNKVIDMNRIFYNCSSLYSIDLSSFDTQNVQDMGFMFYSCNNLR